MSILRVDAGSDSEDEHKMREGRFIKVILICCQLWSGRKKTPHEKIYREDDKSSMESLEVHEMRERLWIAINDSFKDQMPYNTKQKWKALQD